MAKQKRKQSQPGEKRSRSGCLTCRKRRVKCDEIHPKCGHCMRLNLECSYHKKFSWDAEALGNGVTFGRSNQYKKSSLQEKFLDFLSSKNSPIGNQDTYDLFLKSKTSTLSQEILKEDVSWCHIHHKKLHFINMTREDFHLRQVTDVQHFPLETVNTTAPTSMQFIFSLLAHHEDRYFTSEPALVINQKNSVGLLEDSSYSQDHIVDMVSPDIQQSLSLFSPSGPLELPTNLSFTDVDQLFWGFEPKTPVFSPRSFTIPSSLFGSGYDSLSSQEKSLLQYFIDAIGPTCICFPTPPSTNLSINTSNDTLTSSHSKANPYLHLIVPLAFQSQVVMDALIAASAHQLFILGNSKYEQLSDRYSERTIEQLSNTLRQKQRSQCTDWDDFLAAVLMLCFKEISSNRDYRSWVSYLNCAKFFLKKFNSQRTFSPLYKFFARYFIIHEVIGGTAWLQKKVDGDEFDHFGNDSALGFPSETVIIDLNFSLGKGNLINGRNDITKYLPNASLLNDTISSSKAHDTVIDLVFGCCPYLITLIDKISNLGRCYEDLELEPINTRKEFEHYILIQRNELQSEIEGLDQRIQLFPEINSLSENCIKTIAEIKRLSTLLYLFARVDLETLYYNNGRATNYFIEKERCMNKVKSRLVSLFKNLPECPMSLLWPLFVLGLVATTDDDERWFVLDKLVYLQKARELGNVKTAKDVVLKIWKERDLGLISFRWKEMIKGKTESLSLA